MEYSSAADRITRVLFTAQAAGSAGLIAASTVGSIVGAMLGGGAAWAGVPAALYLLGSAFSALAWGYLVSRRGWRSSLITGTALGVAGAALAGAAVMRSSAGQWLSLVVFLVGMVLLGSAQSALQLGRFASAEVHPPSERGRAISNVVLGGAVGAILGPLLVGPVSRWAQGAGFDELAGPYGVTLALCLVACFLIITLLRPDPRDLGREISRLYPEEQTLPASGQSALKIISRPGPLVAVASMVLGQVVMVMVMVITALHMRGHHHALSSVSLVISSHTFGMYAFSVVSGRLADRLGRGLVILSGAGTLLLACLLAPLSPDVVPLAVALFLLGLGWNFCYVGGSSLLSDNLAPAERSRVQGFNDLLIGLTSAASSLSSGLVFAAVGFTVMSMAGAIVAGALIILVFFWLMGNRESADASIRRMGIGDKVKRDA
jgi:MFS family permease